MIENTPLKFLYTCNYAPSLSNRCMWSILDLILPVFLYVHVIRHPRAGTCTGNVYDSTCTKLTKSRSASVFLVPVLSAYRTRRLKRSKCVNKTGKVCACGVCMLLPNIFCCGSMCVCVVCLCVHQHVFVCMNLWCMCLC